MPQADEQFERVLAKLRESRRPEDDPFVDPLSGEFDPRRALGNPSLSIELTHNWVITEQQRARLRGPERLEDEQSNVGKLLGDLDIPSSKPGPLRAAFLKLQEDANREMGTVPIPFLGEQKMTPGIAAFVFMGPPPLTLPPLLFDSKYKRELQEAWHKKMFADAALGVLGRPTPDRDMIDAMVLALREHGISVGGHLVGDDEAKDALATSINNNYWDYLEKTKRLELVGALDRLGDFDNLKSSDIVLWMYGNQLKENLESGSLSAQGRENTLGKLAEIQSKAAQDRQAMLGKLKAAIGLQTMLEHLPLPEERRKLSSFVTGRTMLRSIAENLPIDMDIHAFFSGEPQVSIDAQGQPVVLATEPQTELGVQSVSRALKAIHFLKDITPEQWDLLRQDAYYALKFRKYRSPEERINVEAFKEELGDDAVAKWVLRAESAMYELFGGQWWQIFENHLGVTDRIFRLQDVGMFDNGVETETGTIRAGVDGDFTLVTALDDDVNAYLNAKAAELEIVADPLPELSRKNHENWIKNKMTHPGYGSRASAEDAWEFARSLHAIRTHEIITQDIFAPNDPSELVRQQEMAHLGDRTRKLHEVVSGLTTSYQNYWDQWFQMMERGHERVGHVELFRKASQGAAYALTMDPDIAEQSTDPRAAINRSRGYFVVPPFKILGQEVDPDEFLRSVGLDPREASPESRAAFYRAFGKFRSNVTANVFGESGELHQKERIERMAAAITGNENGDLPPLTPEYVFDAAMMNFYSLTKSLEAGTDFVINDPANAAPFLAAELVAGRVMSFRRGLRIKRFELGRLNGVLRHLMIQDPGTARAMRAEINTILKDGVDGKLPEKDVLRKLEVVRANMDRVLDLRKQSRMLFGSDMGELAMAVREVYREFPDALGQLGVLAKDLFDFPRRGAKEALRLALLEPFVDIGKKFFRTYKNDPTPVIGRNAMEALNRAATRPQVEAGLAAVQTILDESPLVAELEAIQARLATNLDPGERATLRARREAIKTNLEKEVREHMKRPADPEQLLALLESDSQARALFDRPTPRPSGRLPFFRLNKAERKKLREDGGIAKDLVDGLRVGQVAFNNVQMRSAFARIYRTELYKFADRLVENRIKRTEAEFDAADIQGRTAEASSAAAEIERLNALKGRLKSEANRVRAIPLEKKFSILDNDLELWNALEKQDVADFVSLRTGLIPDGAARLVTTIERAQPAFVQGLEKRIRSLRSERSRVKRQLKKIEDDPVAHDKTLFELKRFLAATNSRLRKLQKRRAGEKNELRRLELGVDISGVETDLRWLGKSISARTKALKGGVIRADSHHASAARSQKITREIAAVQRELRHSAQVVRTKLQNDAIDELFGQKGIEGLTKELQGLYKRITEAPSKLLTLGAAKIGTAKPFSMAGMPAVMKAEAARQLVSKNALNAGYRIAQLELYAGIVNRLPAHTKVVLGRFLRGETPLTEELDALFKKKPRLRALVQDLSRSGKLALDPEDPKKAVLENLKTFATSMRDFQMELLEDAVRHGWLSEAEMNDYLQRVYQPKEATVKGRIHQMNTRHLLGAGRSKSRLKEDLARAGKAETPDEVAAAKARAAQFRLQRDNTDYRVFSRQIDGEVIDQRFETEAEALEFLTERFGANLAKKVTGAKRERGVRATKTPLDEEIILADPFKKTIKDPKTGEVVFEDDTPLKLLGFTPFEKSPDLFVKRLEQLILDNQRMSLLTSLDNIGGYLLTKEQFDNLLEVQGENLQGRYVRLPDHGRWSFGRFRGMYIEKGALAAMRRQEGYHKLMRGLMEEMEDATTEGMRGIDAFFNRSHWWKLFSVPHEVSRSAQILLSHGTWLVNAAWNFGIAMYNGSGVLNPFNILENRAIYRRTATGADHPWMKEAIERGIVGDGFFRGRGTPELTRLKNNLYDLHDKDALIARRAELEGLQAKYRAGRADGASESALNDIARDMAAVRDRLDGMQLSYVKRAAREFFGVFHPMRNEIGEDAVVATKLRNKYNAIDEWFRTNAYFNYRRRGLSADAAEFYTWSFHQNYPGVPAAISATRSPFGALGGAFVFESLRIYRNLLLHRPVQTLAFHSVIPALNLFSMMRAGVNPSTMLAQLEGMGAKNNTEKLMKFGTTLLAYNPETRELESTVDFGGALFPLREFTKSRGALRNLMDSLSPPETRGAWMQLVLGPLNAVSQSILNTPLVNLIDAGIGGMKDPFTGEPMWPEGGVTWSRLGRWAARMAEGFVPPMSPIFGREIRLMGDSINSGRDPDTGLNYRAQAPESAISRALMRVAVRGKLAEGLNEVYENTLAKLFVRKGMKPTPLGLPPVNEQRTMKVWIYKISSDEMRSAFAGELDYEMEARVALYQSYNQMLLGNPQAAEELEREGVGLLRRGITEREQKGTARIGVDDLPIRVEEKVKGKLETIMNVDVGQLFSNLEPQDQALLLWSAWKADMSDSFVEGLVADAIVTPGGAWRTTENPDKIWMAMEVVKDQARRMGLEIRVDQGVSAEHRRREAEVDPRRVSRYTIPDGPRWMRLYWDWLVQTKAAAEQAAAEKPQKRAEEREKRALRRDEMRQLLNQ